jgi:hypothetical protein
MKTKLTLVVALGLSMATLTAIAAEQAARDSTSRGTPPTTRPTDPNTPGYPTTPGTTSPGGPYGSMGSSVNFQSFANLSDAEALAVVAAIDSNEINAAKFVQNRKVGKHHTSSSMNNGTSGTKGTSGGTYGSSSGTSSSSGSYGGTSSTHKSTGMSNSTGSVTDDVEDFAEHMRKDHEKNLKDAMSLAKKLNVTVSTAGEPVRMLKQKGKEGMSKLKSAQGMELERTYVNAMVSGHQEVLQIIDTMTGSVTPGSTSGTSSTNPYGSGTSGTQQLSQQVRDFLAETRSIVAEHLQKAQELQGEVSLGQGGGTGSH